MFIESEKRKDAETLAWQAWPVVKYRHETDGTHVEFPSIFPFTNWGPWERSYGPFFRLFQYDGATDGTQSWRLLWRLVRVDSGPDKRYVEVTPLFDVHTQGGAEPQVHWNLLKGLVGYERTPQGREYRLFYFMTLLTD
jgi:hypothetical protein